MKIEIHEVDQNIFKPFKITIVFETQDDVIKFSKAMGIKDDVGYWMNNAANELQKIIDKWENK